MAIGFVNRPGSRNRRAVFSSSSEKLGYIESRAGVQWFTDTNGKVLAKLLRYKEGFHPEAYKDATGGTIVEPQELHEV